jgi:hypothetical protein
MFAGRVVGGSIMNDPIVEEVRRHCMEHTRKFGGDLKRICEDLQRLQRESGCQVVRRPPKLLWDKADLDVALDRLHGKSDRIISGDELRKEFGL